MAKKTAVTKETTEVKEEVKIDQIHMLLTDLKKEFGADSICLLGENQLLSNIPVRSSGSILLDIALGGGYPKGRLIEFRGAEKCGKTTLMYRAIAQAQVAEPDKYCAIIDTENTFSPDWAQKIGVQLDKLFFVQPDLPAEQVYEMILKLVERNVFSIIGLDSLAGLIPKEELEAEDWIKESRVGGASKINAKAVRKIVNSGALAKSGATLIYINQLRDAVGVYSPYGPSTTTGGGRSLKHAYTQILEVSTGQFMSENSGGQKKFVGQEIVVKVQKNKIGPPLRRAVIEIYYDTGIDNVSELIEVAKAIGVLSGTSWLTWVDPRTGEIMKYKGDEVRLNGKVKVREALIEDNKNGGELYKLMTIMVQEIIRRD